MFNHFTNGLKKYANAKGRVSRKEYWSFVLFATIFAAAFYVGTAFALLSWNWGLATLLLLAFVVYIFGIVVPSWCMLVRRMHDTGKSGWFALIPFANIVFACFASKPGHNQYGPNPFEIEDLNFQDGYANNYYNGNNPHAGQFQDANSHVDQFKGNIPYADQPSYSVNNSSVGNGVNSEVSYSNGASTQTDANNKLDEIQECAKLLESGLITQEEFDKMKKDILLM